MVTTVTGSAGDPNDWVVDHVLGRHDKIPMLTPMQTWKVLCGAVQELQDNKLLSDFVGNRYFKGDSVESSHRNDRMRSISGERGYAFYLTESGVWIRTAVHRYWVGGVNTDVLESFVVITDVNAVEMFNVVPGHASFVYEMLGALVRLFADDCERRAERQRRYEETLDTLRAIRASSERATL
jgi:hypothetical protein